MAIVITDNLDCLVDGVNFGQPADVIANNPTLAPAVNVAMRAKLDGVRADATTKIAAKDNEKSVLVAAHAAEKNAIVSERTIAIDKLKEIKAAALAAAPDKLDELKVTIETKADEGTMSDLDRKRAELEAQAAEIAEKLAELPAKP